MTKKHPNQTSTSLDQGRQKASVAAADFRPSGGSYTTSDRSAVWDLDLPADRPEWMFGIRESDEHSNELFAGMRDQTYQLKRDLPFVEVIREAGMVPMSASDSFEVKVGATDSSPSQKVAVPVRRLRRGPTTVIVFRYGPAVHVWCMASAAKINNEDRINDFTWLLIELVLAYRPRNVFTANLSRVVRMETQSGLLLHALVGNVDAIWHGSQRLALSGPEAATGKFQYNMLASFASMERMSILQRLMAGRVARYRMGLWLPGSTLVPPGYKWDSKTKLLEVDESQREVVKQLLIILGSGMPSRAALIEIGRLGIRMPRALDEDGEPARVSRSTTSTAARDSLMAWLNVWVHGQFLYRFSNTGLEIDDLSGVPVVRRDERDVGEFQMVFNVPLPEGGWAPPAVLERAVAAARERWEDFTDIKGEPRPLHESISAQLIDRELAVMQFRRRHRKPGHLAPAKTRSGKSRRGPTGGAARERVAPLVGRSWQAGEIAFRIGGMNSGMYRVTATAKGEVS